MLIRLGFTPVVVISSSEAAEEVLKTKDLETCSRTKLMATGKLSYNFKDITFAPYNDSWREYRKVAVMELLNPKKLQTLKFIREEEMDFVVKKISNSALEQSPVAVDLSKISFSLAANILCRTALGQNLRTNKFFDEERIIKLVEEGSVASGRLGFNDFFPGKLAKFADWLFQRKKGILERMFKELDEFYQHVIDDHLKSLDGPKSTDPPADIVAGLLNMVDKNGTCSTRNVDHVKGTLMVKPSLIIQIIFSISFFFLITICDNLLYGYIVHVLNMCVDHAGFFPRRDRYSGNNYSVGNGRTQ